MTLGTQHGDKSLLKPWLVSPLELGEDSIPGTVGVYSLGQPLLILGPPSPCLSSAWVHSQPLSGEVSWGLRGVRRPDLALAQEVKLESSSSVQPLPPPLGKSPSELTGRM